MSVTEPLAEKPREPLHPVRREKTRSLDGGVVDYFRGVESKGHFWRVFFADTGEVTWWQVFPERLALRPAGTDGPP